MILTFYTYITPFIPRYLDILSELIEILSDSTQILSKLNGILSRSSDLLASAFFQRSTHILYKEIPIQNSHKISSKEILWLLLFDY